MILLNTEFLVLKGIGRNKGGKQKVMNGKLFFPNDLIGDNVAGVIGEISSRTDYFLIEESIFDGPESIYKAMLSIFSIENSASPVEKVIVASHQEHDLTGIIGELDTSSLNVVLLEVNVF
ncbi:hypothetical protein [Vibrio crassostreae]|uniref:hypothetical protein n=1 Tax=Vibrio crassostreae TaxID=246167 RepID=UPI00104537D3|nr:hypothetical protein [Vibrio crassostreae]